MSPDEPQNPEQNIRSDGKPEKDPEGRQYVYDHKELAKIIVDRFKRNSATLHFSELHIDFSNPHIAVYFNFRELCRNIQDNDPNNAFNFEKKDKHLSIPYETDFINTLFKGNALFSDTIFKKKANFYRTTFEKEAHFTNTLFKEEALFSRTTFKKKAYFYLTTFGNTANFSRTTFEKEAGFYHTTFGNTANFMNATFGNTAYFKNATFEKEANFMNATFEKEADFYRTTFRNKASFNKLTLEGVDCELSFNSLPLENETTLYFSFSNTSSPDARIEFKNVNGIMGKTHVYIKQKEKADEKGEDNKNHIPKIKFTRCELEENNVRLTNLDIERLNINRLTTWKNFSFIQCRWPKVRVPCAFMKCHALTDEKPSRNDPHEPPKEPSNTDKYALRSQTYAHLKTQAIKDGDAQLSSDFYFWQMYYQGKETGDWTNGFYRLTSNYGLSWRRPLAGLVLILVVFSFIYSSIEHGTLFTGNFDPNAVTRSLETTFSFFKMPDTPEDSNSNSLREMALIIVFILQRTASLYLLFQLGAAIRNRVKR